MVLASFDMEKTSVYTPRELLPIQVTRQDAAAFIHEFLRLDIKEPDSDNRALAADLLDLYDCHTCVEHITQVYVKGIIEKDIIDGKTVFNLRKPLYEKEASLICERMKDVSLRIGLTKMSLETACFVKPDELTGFLSDKSSIIVYDLSEKPDGRFDGIALSAFMNNPLEYCKDRFTPVLFVCENGYKSAMASNAAVSYGVKEVYYSKLL